MFARVFRIWPVRDAWSWKELLQGFCIVKTSSALYFLRWVLHACVLTYFFRSSIRSLRKILKIIYLQLHKRYVTLHNHINSLDDNSRQLKTLKTVHSAKRKKQNKTNRWKKKKRKINIIRNWNDYILCSQKKGITNNKLLASLILSV